MATGTYIDYSGGLFNGYHNQKPRRQLIDAFLKSHNERRISARYDAAADYEDQANHWAAADDFDADSANSASVRRKLVRNSRHETFNNGYSDGIAQTYCTDLVGIGPKLRMQTGSQGFNQMVEAEWQRWCQAVKFRRKLWCQAHAKHTDGEGIGIIRRNPKVKHPVKIDYVLYETEQCATPYLLYGEAGYIDGIKFDEFGNPEYYDILKYHPGASRGFNFDMKPEKVSAEFVCHWFKLRRPGQHRGIPEMTSTLNLGAGARRWRESTLSTAELIAKMTLFLKSNLSGNSDDLPSPLSTLDVQTGMMAMLPDNVEPWQPKAEQPAATYEMFNRANINEQARCKNMPYNKAACDSSSYNYASGRLDHQTYYGALDVDREDGNDLVLDHLFGVWFDLAIAAFGWLGGDPDAVSPAAKSHAWDWPKHPVADLATEASANSEKLKTGQTTLTRIYSEAGEDFEDELVAMAADYGKTVDEMRDILHTALFNAQGQQASLQSVEVQRMQASKTGTSRDIVEAIQKIYLGVGRVLTSDEARKILNRDFDAELAIPGPSDLGPSVPTPPDGAASPAPTGASNAQAV